jgi:hypothetical protein
MTKPNNPPGTITARALDQLNRQATNMAKLVQEQRKRTRVTGTVDSACEAQFDEALRRAALADRRE